jgi:hypothetical protein
MRGLCPLLCGILQPQLQRIHLQRFGEFIEHALDRVGADRRAWRAIGRDLGAVGEHVEADRQHVRDIVGRKAAADRAADRRTGQRAGLQIKRALRGNDSAVLFGADFDRALGARGRARRPHHLFAGHHHLDRAAGFFRKQGRQRLEIDDGLAAETAANFSWNGADIALRNPGQVRRHGAHHELALARTPDRGLVVGADADQAGVRLDIALMHRARRK